MRRFPAPRSGFVLLYALAFIGMFISFMPYGIPAGPAIAFAAGPKQTIPHARIAARSMRA